MKKFRESEIKHARIAMLAITGMFVQELAHPLFENGSKDLGPAIGHFQQVTSYFPLMPALLLVIVGIFEGNNIYGKRVRARWGGGGGVLWFLSLEGGARAAPNRFCCLSCLGLSSIDHASGGGRSRSRLLSITQDICKVETCGPAGLPFWLNEKPHATSVTSSCCCCRCCFFFVGLHLLKINQRAQNPCRSWGQPFYAQIHQAPASKQSADPTGACGS